MKLYNLAIILVLSSSTVKASTMMRGLHRGNGGQLVQAKVDEKCDSGKVTCPEDTSSLGCDALEGPDKPEFTGIETDEEKQAIWRTMKEAKEAFRRQVVSCSCCTGATLEELGVPSKDGEEGHSFGGKGGGMHQMVQSKVDEKCDSGEVTCPEDTPSLGCDALEGPDKPEFTGTETYEEKQAIWRTMKEAKEAFRRQVVSCSCCTGATLEELGVPSKDGEEGHSFGGKGGGMHQMVQSKVDEKCDSGEVTCPEDTSSLGCDALEGPGKPEFTGTETDEEKQAVWSAMKVARGEFREKIISCACCTSTTLEDLGISTHSIELGVSSSSGEGYGSTSGSSEDGVETFEAGVDNVDVAVLLASAKDSSIQAEEPYLNSSGSLSSLVLSIASVFAGVALAFA